jgi:hypothetical protein
MESLKKRRKIIPMWKTEGQRHRNGLRYLNDPEATVWAQTGFIWLRVGTKNELL